LYSSQSRTPPHRQQRFQASGISIAKVALDATNAHAHSDYAIVLLQLQRLPEAETQARAADAKSPGSHDLMDQILAQKHQSAAAAAEFRVALLLAPGFGPAQFDLAQTLIEQGHTHDAEPYLEQAVRSPIGAIAGQAHQLPQQIGPR
jgi:predicted Zn-dependent protease